MDSSTIEHLDKSDSGLQSLPYTSYPKLQTLDISGNNLRRLSFSAPLLQSLDSSNNLVESLDFISIFPLLRHAKLSGNLIKSANFEQENHAVESLLLDGNLIDSVGPLRFTRLASLDLANNFLASVDGLRSLAGTLRALNLANNKLFSLHSISILGDFRALDQLTIEGNELEEVLASRGLYTPGFLMALMGRAVASLDGQAVESPLCSSSKKGFAGKVREASGRMAGLSEEEFERVFSTKIEVERFVMATEESEDVLRFDECGVIDSNDRCIPYQTLPSTDMLSYSLPIPNSNTNTTPLTLSSPTPSTLQPTITPITSPPTIPPMIPPSIPPNARSIGGWEVSREFTGWLETCLSLPSQASSTQPLNPKPTAIARGLLLRFRLRRIKRIIASTITIQKFIRGTLVRRALRGPMSAISLYLLSTKSSKPVSSSKAKGPPSSTKPLVALGSFRPQRGSAPSKAPKNETSSALKIQNLLLKSGKTGQTPAGISGISSQILAKMGLVLGPKTRPKPKNAP